MKATPPHVAPWSSSFSSYLHLSEASLPQRRASACASEKRAATARFAEATNMRGGPGARQLRKIERYYRRARTAYEKAGRTLVDATPNGSCTVFRKVASVEAALEAFGVRDSQSRPSSIYK